MHGETVELFDLRPLKTVCQAKSELDDELTRKSAKKLLQQLRDYEGNLEGVQEQLKEVMGKRQRLRDVDSLVKTIIVDIFEALDEVVEPPATDAKGVLALEFSRKLESLRRRCECLPPHWLLDEMTIEDICKVIECQNQLCRAYSDFFGTLYRSVSTKDSWTRQPSISSGSLIMETVRQIVDSRLRDVTKDGGRHKQMAGTGMVAEGVLAHQSFSSGGKQDRRIGEARAPRPAEDEHNTVQIVPLPIAETRDECRGEKSLLDKVGDSIVGKINALCPSVSEFRAWRIRDRVFRLKWRWPEKVSGAVINVKQQGQEDVTYNIERGLNSEGETDDVYLTGIGLASATIQTYCLVENEAIKGATAVPLLFGEQS